MDPIKPAYINWLSLAKGCDNLRRVLMTISDDVTEDRRVLLATDTHRLHAYVVGPCTPVTTFHKQDERKNHREYSPDIYDGKRDYATGKIPVDEDGKELPYPNWRRLVPDDNDAYWTMEFDARELQAVLKTFKYTKKFVKEQKVPGLDADRIRVAIAGGTATLCSLDANGTPWGPTQELAVTGTLLDASWAVKSEYLRDAVSVFEDRVIIRTASKDGARPVVIKAPGTGYMEDLWALVMPMSNDGRR